MGKWRMGEGRRAPVANLSIGMGFGDVMMMLLKCGIMLMFLAQLPNPCCSMEEDDWNPIPTSGLRVQSEYGSALMLPLSGSKAEHRHHRRRRGRELVADARMTLHDDLLTKGWGKINLKSSGVPTIYYTSRVFIGTPPQEFALIVDTGSTVSYVPCSTCTHCGHHQDPRFKPDNSSSYTVVECGSGDCKTGMCDSNNHQCRYERNYAEMSSSKGVLGKDFITFGQDSQLVPQDLLFGCETSETGDLYLQHADGIMGLGRGPLSIVDQLVGSGAMADAFSLCYGGMDVGGGAMVLGAIPPVPEMVFAPSDPNRSYYYNLNLSEIWVQGIRLELESSIFNGKFGTVLDSGTTYAYLPDQAFEAFRDAVINQLGALQAVDGPDPNYPDICYAGAGSDITQLDQHFPPVDFVFGENSKVTLAPENYLFKHTKVPGAYCLGFFKNQDATTLLGGIVVRNMLVTYDRSNHQIGFLKTNCTNLWSILPGNTTAIPPPPPSSPVNEQIPPPPQEISSPPQVTSNPLPVPAPAPSTEVEQEFESIEFMIALGANSTTFLNQSSLFLSSIASELAVLPSQVSIEEVKKVQQDDKQVVVRFIITLQPQHFSTSHAEAIAAQLVNHSIHLPDVFGSYHFIGWKGVPHSKWWWIQSKNGRVTTLIVILVGVVLVLAAGASLVYWYLLRYRDKATAKYNNLDEVGEEETLMSDEMLLSDQL